MCAGSVARSWTEAGAELHDALEMSHAVVKAPRQEWLDTTAVRLEPQDVFYARAMTDSGR